MADKQEVFWISKKTSYKVGKDKFLEYGDPIDGIIPEEMIPHFKSTGEIGTVEAAKPEGVKTDAAFKKVNEKLKAAEEKLVEYEIAADNVIAGLKQDKLKKEEKEKLVAELEALK
jgi:hypothetical protein